MIPLSLTVNGRRVDVEVEPRTALADFLRDRLDLTGTHLGCEHGVCGACTVLLDGVPTRSCITMAAACCGAGVTTIEGLDDDGITAELRAAFAREHALQCGYCTPGMLVSARDLVLRLEEPSERQIRLAMSGNLCRCTGYAGIVRAIRGVIAERRARGEAAAPGAGRTALGPAGAHEPRDDAAPAYLAAAPGVPAGAVFDDVEDFVPAAAFSQRFTVAFPQAQVFAFISDVAAVAACLPGAAVTAAPAPDRVEGEMRVKLGPITSTFRGAARVTRDPAALAGRIAGSGTDARGRSSVRGAVDWRVLSGDAPGTSTVEIEVGYALSGVLAQFGRPGLVKDLAGRLVAEFAANLEASLSGAAPASIDAGTLDAAGLIMAVLRGWGSRVITWLRGKGR